MAEADNLAQSNYQMLRYKTNIFKLYLEAKEKSLIQKNINYWELKNNDHDLINPGNNIICLKIVVYAYNFIHQ